jgi:uroporphyrinogen decarboxylase
MISGVDNYRRAIEFKRPEYLPWTLGVGLEWMNEKNEAKAERIRELEAQFPKDISGWWEVGKHCIDPVTVDGVSRWKDEWGTGWVDDGHGDKTESYPFEDGYEKLSGFLFPDPNLSGRFDRVDKAREVIGDKYQRSCVWFTLFERLWMLRGFENMLMDPYLNESDFCSLRDRIVEYDMALIDKWIERGVHGVFFSDDWGCQKGMLMSPVDWRKFYLPSYKRMFDRVHAGGAHVWMHLCGNITDILGDLIDIGLNVLNPVQPQAMDVRYLSKEFGGKVCFNGGADVQGTLIHGSTDDVKREVHQLVDLFGRFDGGYIGGTSHSIMPETPLDNVIALYEAFLEYR